MTKRTNSKFTGTQRLALMNAIQKDYPTSGMTDGVFAAHVAKLHGFSVEREDVVYYRKSLGVSANARNFAQQASVKYVMREEYDALLVKLDALTKRVDALDAATLHARVTTTRFGAPSYGGDALLGGQAR